MSKPENFLDWVSSWNRFGSRALRWCLVALLLSVGTAGAADMPVATNKPALGVANVDASTLRGKVMCGYQGWFRCPADDANHGWIHWSRESQRIAPELLTFEMWPDMADYSAPERYPAPGFTYPNGQPAELFSSANARTVLRHFEWMRDYGIDGAWLQHFLVDLPGGPISNRYPSRLQVLNHVRAAARETGRAWALSYDIAGMPTEHIFDVLTADWKKMVDEKVTDDLRHLHQDGKPVVQIWGFYSGDPHNPMTAELAGRLIDFFRTPGRYSAFLVGGAIGTGGTIPTRQEKSARPLIIGPKTSVNANVRACSGSRWFIRASVGTICSG